jgi:hypothetical protein
VEKYGYLHLSAGQLLRDESARLKSKGESSQIIDDGIEKGKIIPVH